LILTFDGLHYNYEHHFKDLHAPDSVLVYGLTTHHLIVEAFAGTKAVMIVNAGNSWVSEYLKRDLGSVAMGPSIANTGFDLACRMGADPIILVGQDLSFTEQRSHVEGTHQEGFENFRYRIPEEWLSGKQGTESDDPWVQHWLAHKLIWVDGVDGKKVPTDERMLTFLHWLENRIEKLNGERTVIDATEGGAKIRGTRIMTLQETLNEYCSRDISHRTAEIKPRLEAATDYDMRGLLHYLKRVYKTVCEAAEHCRRAASIADTLTDHFCGRKSAKVAKLLARLQKVDRFLKRKQEFYRPIHFLTAPILAIAQEAGEESDGEKVATCKQSYLLYSQLQSAFSSSKLPLRALLDHLQASERLAGAKGVAPGTQEPRSAARDQEQEKEATPGLKTLDETQRLRQGNDEPTL
jgi:hypothetical protein